MAYQGTTYTGEADALDKFITFALANGWTENSISSGRQITKNIGGVDAYFNFNSVASGNPYTGATNYGTFTNGIAVIGSTGTSAGSSWRTQPGATPVSSTDSTPCGGSIDRLDASTNNCHFFANDTTLHAVFQTINFNDDWSMLTIGVNNGNPFYECSGGYTGTQDATWGSYRAAYASGTVQSTTATAGPAGRCALWDGVAWHVGQTTSTPTTPAIWPQYSHTISTMAASIKGSLSAPILAYTPDPFRGNTIMAPFELFVNQSDSLCYPVGIVEGVLFVNMKNLSEGAEITYGGGTYKCFSINKATYYYRPRGLAFLK